MISDSKISPLAEAALDRTDIGAVTGTGLTAAEIYMHQFRARRLIAAVEAFARTVTATISVDVGIVNPGSKVDTGALGVAANTTGAKLTGPMRYIAPDGTYRNKATADNQAFTQVAAANPTINVGNAAGQFWGAARIQIDSAGTISMKYVAANQSYATEQNAIDALPAADSDKVSLGYVTVRTKANVSFTFNVGVITGAGAGANDAATVNWTNTANGYLSVLTGAITPVATDVVRGTLQSAVQRVVVKKYGLLLCRITTDGTGAATNLNVTISHRPFPMNGEVLPNGF